MKRSKWFSAKIYYKYIGSPLHKILCFTRDVQGVVRKFLSKFDRQLQSGAGIYYDLDLEVFS